MSIECRWPCQRLLAPLVCLICFVLTATLHTYDFRYTLPGGFVAALLPGLLLLPHIKSEAIEWLVPPLAALITLGIFLAL